MRHHSRPPASCPVGGDPFGLIRGYDAAFAEAWARHMSSIVGCSGDDVLCSGGDPGKLPFPALHLDSWEDAWARANRRERDPRAPDLGDLGDYRYQTPTAYGLVGLEAFREMGRAVTTVAVCTPDFRVELARARVDEGWLARHGVLHAPALPLLLVRVEPPCGVVQVAAAPPAGPLEVRPGPPRGWFTREDSEAKVAWSRFPAVPDGPRGGA